MDTNFGRRRIYSVRERIELIEQQERSGLSQAAFCRRANIHPVTFCGWRRALGQRVPAFAEVQVSAPVVATRGSAPVVSAAAVMHLRNGAKLEVALGGESAWAGLGVMLKTLQA
jgi:transposase-like protein